MNFFEYWNFGKHNVFFFEFFRIPKNPSFFLEFDPKTLKNPRFFWNFIINSKKSLGFSRFSTNIPKKT